MSGKAARRSIARRAMTFRGVVARFGARFFHRGWLGWGRRERVRIVEDARKQSPHKATRDRVHRDFMRRFIASTKLEDAQHGRNLAKRRTTHAQVSQ